MNVVSEFICYHTILHWLCKLQEVCISSMLILLKELWPVYMFQNLKWLVIYFMWSGLLFIVIVDLRSFCPTFYHVSNMAYERLGSPGCQDSFVHLLLCPHGYLFWSGAWKLNLKITETDAFSFSSSFSCYPTLLTSDQIHHGNLFKCRDAKLLCLLISVLLVINV